MAFSILRWLEEKCVPEYYRSQKEDAEGLPHILLTIKSCAVFGVG